MELKNVIHYYLGQNVVYENKIYSLRSINEHSIKTGSNGCFIFIDADDCHWVHLKDIQLLIRPLASMTWDEIKPIWKLIFNKDFPPSGRIIFIDEEVFDTDKRFIMTAGAERVGICLNGNVWADSDLHHWKFNYGPVFHHLVSLGVDLFELLPRGLAVEQSKTLNT